MKTTIETLLKLDMNAAASSIGLLPAFDVTIHENSIYEIINSIELAILEGGREKDISSVCGLLWTHFHDNYDLLGDYILSVMTRIGFAPVSSMLLAQGSGNEMRIKTASLISAMETTVQMKKESVRVFGASYNLTKFQKSLWTELNNSRHVAVSAPTSAGKSFLICLKLLAEIADRSGTSIYIVPTLTLMGQVVNDLVSLARHHGKHIEVRTHLLETKTVTGPVVYVVTQERLTDHLRIFKDITNLHFLIIDEIQNIERAFEFENNDSRAKLLLDVIIDVHDKFNPQRTVISGPRISEIKDLGEKLFRKTCSPIVAEASPVTNICYAIRKSTRHKDQVLFTQYSELQLNHNEVHCENTIGATGFGKAQYNEDFHDYLEKVVTRNEGSLIFSPTARQARKTALRLAAGRSTFEGREIESLANYIEDTVVPKYDLAICVKKGVAFHHGKLPHHVRNAIEFAVQKGMLSFVTCTTTLMQGVNIPAKNVVMRNPNLYINKRKGESAKLSGYEISNLRGRAGRLLKDFVGRTFVLDGSAFEAEDEEQLSLFQPAEKKLDGTYSEVFKRNREQIIDSLATQGKEQSSLAKYIGNIIYTEENATEILSRKGIALTADDFAAIRGRQKILDVDKSVCKSHRYWDPFDLQLIHEKRQLIPVPVSPFEAGASGKLKSALSVMTSLVPQAAEHLLGKSNIATDRKVWVVAINAFEWANETPLHELLDSDYVMSNSDNTDDAISLLQRTISYGLPALLSPLYAMTNPKAMMLGAIERGAYKPGTVVQINNNVPRETAITVSMIAKGRGVVLRDLSDVLSFVKTVNLGYWDKIQFRHLADLH